MENPGRGNPSLGMLKRREAVRRKISFPFRALLFIAGGLALLSVLVLLTTMSGGGIFRKKSGLIWLIPLGSIVYGLFILIAWPLTRLSAKHELEMLEEFDTLEDFHFYCGR